MGLITKLFGTYSERELKSIYSIRSRQWRTSTAL